MQLSEWQNRKESFPAPGLESVRTLSKYISENYGIKTRVANSLREAANLSLETATKKDVIVAFGSLYYVGLIKEEFLSLLNAAPLRS